MTTPHADLLQQIGKLHNLLYKGEISADEARQGSRYIMSQVKQLQNEVTKLSSEQTPVEYEHPAHTQKGLLERTVVENPTAALEFSGQRASERADLRKEKQKTRRSELSLEKEVTKGENIQKQSELHDKKMELIDAKTQAKLTELYEKRENDAQEFLRKIELELLEYENKEKFEKVKGEQNRETIFAKSEADKEKIYAKGEEDRATIEAKSEADLLKIQAQIELEQIKLEQERVKLERQQSRERSGGGPRDDMPRRDTPSGTNNNRNNNIPQPIADDNTLGDKIGDAVRGEKGQSFFSNWGARGAGGRMGQIGGSALYATGAGLNEIGQAGGKDAANFASVARGVGGLAMAAELLGNASTGAQFAILGVSAALIGGAIMAEKYTRELERVTTLEHIYGVTELGGTTGTKGLSQQTAMSSKDMTALRIMPKFSQEFEQLSLNEKLFYGMIASTIEGISPDAIGQGEQEAYAVAQYAYQQSQLYQQGHNKDFEKNIIDPFLSISGVSGSQQHRGELKAAFVSDDPSQMLDVLFRPYEQGGFDFRGDKLFTDRSTKTGKMFSQDFISQLHLAETGQELGIADYDAHLTEAGAGQAKTWDRLTRDLGWINPAHQEEAYKYQHFPGLPFNISRGEKIEVSYPELADKLDQLISISQEELDRTKTQNFSSVLTGGSP